MPMAEAFAGAYRGTKVLVTGHTGFKGSWLSLWLSELGAEVVGYSLDPPSQPSNFHALTLNRRLKHIKGDVRDRGYLQNVFDELGFEIVFHLAAQAITGYSYTVPQETFTTNVCGTVNVLDSIRLSESVKAAVIITSDKCYENNEWLWGYRENDRLGGDDPYSASKACAEIACHSFMKSFFMKNCLPRVCTARAGNVVGGGDWAIDRVVPDCVRAFVRGETLVVRNGKATRPWQHVLEPLSGYLWLGARLLHGDDRVADQSFNFGPTEDVCRTVEELVADFAMLWGDGKWCVHQSNCDANKECRLLKLCCDKALHCLGWHTALSFKETLKMTADWYKAFYVGHGDMYSFSTRQIHEYEATARARGLSWAST